MAIWLTELIDRVVPGMEDIVNRARQRFNQNVRQILRDETRLRLSTLVSDKDGEERETRAVRVFVTAGMPVELESMTFQDDLWLAIEIAPLKGLLETTHQTMSELNKPIERLSEYPEFQERFPGVEDAVLGMRDLAAGLLAEAAKFDLLGKIFAIDEDVLGLYSFAGLFALSVAVTTSTFKKYL